MGGDGQSGAKWVKVAINDCISYCVNMYMYVLRVLFLLAGHVCEGDLVESKRRGN